MTQRLEIYRCNICKNIVEILLEGEGALVCCGEEMELLKPGTTDGAEEKHVPVIDYECAPKDGAGNSENTGDRGVKIRVGEFPHPMTEEHYIQFIEAVSPDNKTVHREYLYPGEAPEISVNCRSNFAKRAKLRAREYCNIHGLYISKDDENECTQE